MSPPLTITRFRAGDYLRTPAEIAEFLRASVEQFPDDAAALAEVMREVARVLEQPSTEAEG